MRKPIIFSIFCLFVGITGCDKDCNKSDEGLQLFSSTIGTKWTYADTNGETFTWELTGHKEINGEAVLELSKLSETNSDTTKHYYRQEGNFIYRYAEALPKMWFAIEDSFNTDILKDTLVVYSSPSLEYVLEADSGFVWTRKILQVTTTGFEEVKIQYKSLGMEEVTTSAGTYDCTVIEYVGINESVHYYVSRFGVVQLKSELNIGPILLPYNFYLVEKE